MTPGFSISEAMALEQSLQLGLKRTTLPQTSFSHALSAKQPLEQTLSLISLASERLQMSDNNANGFNSPVQLMPQEDPRVIMPDSLRVAFMRVAVYKKSSGYAWECFCHSMKTQLDKAKIRPHPFDLSRIQHYLSQMQSVDESYEKWFLKHTSETRTSQDEVLDWDNWQLAGKAEQSDFLQRNRELHPEQMRVELEQVFSKAPAASRQVYIEALETGLSETDRPFLESLLQDRSKKVVEMAEKLLARFPGSHSAKKNQETLKSLLGSGFLRSKIGIKKQKGKKASELLYQVAELAEQMHINDIAVMLEQKPEDLPDKIESELAFPFAKSAALAQNYGLVAAFLQKEKAEHLINDIDEIYHLVKSAPLQVKLDLARLMVAPLSKSDGLEPATLSTLYYLIESPLPEDLATNLLKSKAFKASYKHIMSLKNAGQSVGVDAIALMAMLMPPALHTAYLEAISELPFNMNNDPKPYLDFISKLSFQGKQS